MPGISYFDPLIKAFKTDRRRDIMSEETNKLWYYAEGEKSVGPMPFADLTDVLLRTAKPSDLLVWRPGFAQWKRAEEVSEFAGPYPCLARKLEWSLQ